MFLYVSNPQSRHYASARRFFEKHAGGTERILLCGFVPVEIYLQLRNPAVFAKPTSAVEAAAFCEDLRRNPAWEFGDYEPIVAGPLWQWAGKTTAGFRQMIDARLAFTLRHHGVTHFAADRLIWELFLSGPQAPESVSRPEFVRHGDDVIMNSSDGRFRTLLQAAREFPAAEID